MHNDLKKMPAQVAGNFLYKIKITVQYIFTGNYLSEDIAASAARGVFLKLEYPSYELLPDKKNNI